MMAVAIRVKWIRSGTRYWEGNLWTPAPEIGNWVSNGDCQLERRRLCEIFLTNIMVVFSDVSLFMRIQPHNLYIC